MDKEKLLKLLKEVLANDERVIFAYIYGSFVKEQSFRDIDIGIYLKDCTPNEETEQNSVSWFLSYWADCCSSDC